MDRLPMTLFGSLSMPPLVAESKQEANEVKIKVKIIGELRDSFLFLIFYTTIAHSFFFISSNAHIFMTIPSTTAR